MNTSRIWGIILGLLFFLMSFLTSEVQADDNDCLSSVSQIKDNLYFKIAKSLLIEGKEPKDVNKKDIISAIWKIPAAKVLASSCLVQQLFTKGLAEYSKNQTFYDKYLPEFGSLAQNVTPRLMQKANVRTKLENLELPATARLKVDRNASTKTLNVRIHNPTLKHKSCPNCLHAAISKPWISTGAYAKPGQMVKVKIPKAFVGKFGIQLGCHTDDLLRNNLKRWARGTPNIRPARVTQTYPRESLKEE